MFGVTWGGKVHILKLNEIQQLLISVLTFIDLNIQYTVHSESILTHSFFHISLIGS